VRIGGRGPHHLQAPEIEREFQIRQACTHYAFAQMICKEIVMAFRAFLPCVSIIAFP
jgi:hypothetical protein